MGMAASQAKLLSLTSRLHDVELKAQNIEAQKIQLATQQDEAYQKYCDALDATLIRVAYNKGDGTKMFVDANYESVCGFNEERFQQYALRDNRSDRMIVSKEVAEMYEDYSNDKYAFAWAMVLRDVAGPDMWDAEGLEFIDAASGMDVGKVNNWGFDDSDWEYGNPESQTLYMTLAESQVFEDHEDDSKLTELYNKILEADSQNEQKALDKFRDYLYKTYSNEIWEYQKYNPQALGNDEELYDDRTWEGIKNEFNYYVNLWISINEAGGCQELDPLYQSGEEGTAWLNNMVEAGLVTILELKKNGTYKNGWQDTNVATSTNNNYIQRQEDEKERKKIEAEYENELKIINRKDTKFDTELSKLETERTAITKEIESVKKVKDENIDRTFGIFS